jgi:hypothetical protein
VWWCNFIIAEAYQPASLFWSVSPCLNTMWLDPEKWHPGLTSGLHMHIYLHICEPSWTYVYIHTHNIHYFSHNVPISFSSFSNGTIYIQVIHYHRIMYDNKNVHSGRAWWLIPLIPALGRQRQVNFWVWGQPGLQSEFQDSQGYTEKPCLEKPKKKKKKKDHYQIAPESIAETSTLCCSLCTWCFHQSIFKTLLSITSFVLLLWNW